jgi:hypothetical protein
VSRQLRDLQSAELTDHMRLRPAHIDPAGQIVSELVLEGQDRCRTAQLENIDGIVFLHDRRHRQRWRDFADRQGDVGVGGVFAVGQDEPGEWRRRTFVTQSIVVLSSEHRDLVSEQLCGASRVGFQDDIRYLFGDETRNQAGGDGIVLHNDHVTVGALRDLPGRSQAHAGLEPRCVEQSDEEKRRHHQEEDHAGEQHDDAEEPTDVAGERNVAEA